MNEFKTKCSLIFNISTFFQDLAFPKDSKMLRIENLVLIIHLTSLRIKELH